MLNKIPEFNSKNISYIYNFFRDYFPSKIPNFNWDKEILKVNFNFPENEDFYIDPNILDGLNWWKKGTKIKDIPFLYRQNKNYSIFLNDCWTLYSWSKLFRNLNIKKLRLPDEIILIHLDSHTDLMSPHLIFENKELKDILSNQKIDILKPNSIKSGINTGSIGIGSYILPLILRFSRVHIRHLRQLNEKNGLYKILITKKKDKVLGNGKFRPNLKFSERISLIPDNNFKDEKKITTYFESNEYKKCFYGLPDAKILLHIDLDYFNNRFNGDSNYKDKINNLDPDLNTILEMIDKIFDYLIKIVDKKNIIDISVGISPGFFPSEYWSPTIKRLEYYLDLLKT